MDIDEIRGQVRRGEVRPIPDGGGAISQPAPLPLRSGHSNWGPAIAGGLVLAVLGVAAPLLLHASAPPHPPYPITEFPQPVSERVTAVQLNVRGGPGSSFPVISTAPAGQTLTAYGTAMSTDGGTWHFVKLADGSVGYVNSKLVSGGQVSTTTVPDSTAPVAVASQSSVVTSAVPQELSPIQQCLRDAKVDGTLGELICGDQELSALNQRDLALHEERIQVEGESRREKIETDRAALQGILWTCGAFGDRRTCVARTLEGDINQLTGLINHDRQEASVRAAAGSPPS